MNRLLARSLTGFAVALALPLAAHAHRAWMLPSATVLSGTDPWVTVDAAISNDLFYFEHHAMPVDDVVILTPDGSTLKPENIGKGEYRTTFDVQLKQQGTYKIAAIRGGGMNASYKVGSETKRWRGDAASFAKEVPANATDLKVSQNSSRIEVFATLGKPSTSALALTNTGLELQPVTHPTDLIAGEEARFKLMLDGKPAPDLEVTIIPHGIRYRDQLNEIKVKTGADGAFAVTWPNPGMYYLNASIQDNKASVPNATRRAQYTATLEVLHP